MTEASQEKPDAAEEDLRLIERVLGGDRQAFEALVRSHERRVFRVTLAVLGQVEDAEDAMQETFIKAYRHLKQFRRESRFTTWLTRIAVNEALQRRQSRKDHLPLDESSPAQHRDFPGLPIPKTCTQSRNSENSWRKRSVPYPQSIERL